MANLLATKPLSMLTNEASEVSEHTLKRALGPVNLVTLGIGAIIGAGIFVLTGSAAAQYAGPAIVLSLASRISDDTAKPSTTGKRSIACFVAKHSRGAMLSTAINERRIQRRQEARGNEFPANPRG